MKKLCMFGICCLLQTGFTLFADYYDWQSPADCAEKKGTVIQHFYCGGFHYPDDVCCKISEALSDKVDNQMPVQSNQDVVNILGTKLAMLAQKITDALSALTQKLEQLGTPESETVTTEQKAKAG